MKRDKKPVDSAKCEAAARGPDAWQQSRKTKSGRADSANSGCFRQHRETFVELCPHLMFPLMAQEEMPLNSAISAVECGAAAKGSDAWQQSKT